MDESIVEAMQAWGAPPEDIEKVRAQLPDPDAQPLDETFAVHADNAPVIEAFTALRTQWTYVTSFTAVPGGGFLPVSHRVGINYAALIAWVQQHARPRRRRALIADLRVMETAVLIADQEKRTEKE